MVFENNGERPTAAHYSASFYPSYFFGDLALFVVRPVFVARKPPEEPGHHPHSRKSEKCYLRFPTCMSTRDSTEKERDSAQKTVHIAHKGPHAKLPAIPQPWGSLLLSDTKARGWEYQVTFLSRPTVEFTLLIMQCIMQCKMP